MNPSGKGSSYWEKMQQIQTQFELALLEKTSINECTAIVKKKSPLEIIIYIVSSSNISLEQICSYLDRVLDEVLLLKALVPLSNLPLTATGEVDKLALMNLPIIDESLIEQVEKQLNYHHKIEQAVVVVQELRKNIPSLHLSDLIPDWQDKNAIAGGEALPIANVAPILKDSQHNTQQHFLEPKPLAISHGSILPDNPHAPITLPEVLQRAAQQVTSRGIIYLLPDGTELHQSYAELLSQAERILGGLKKLGLKPQEKVIFQLEQNQDFIPAFWGCLLGGFVPVPISIAPTYEQVNSTLSKLKNIWQMLGQPIVLTSASLAPKIRGLSKLLNLENFQVQSIDELQRCKPDSNCHISQADDLALLMLTSGSTGIPKAVTLSHHNLLSMTAGTIFMNGFDRQDVSLNWMPMDHVGALVFLSIMAVELGCQQVHIPTENILQNPLKWLDLIHRHRGSISWAPNFAFTLLCDRAEEINRKHWDLSSMRFLVNAGEAVVTKTARNFLKLLGQHGLPSTALHPAFGMCETCSGITWSNSFSLETTTDDDAFVAVGFPIAGASVRIVDRNGEVVEEGAIGRLQLRGNSVTLGYYQNPKANQEAFNKEGWFTTGDLGFLLDGCLTITGREKDVIIINGLNYYCHEIEAAVEEVEGVEVSYTAACAVREPEINTDKLAIFFSSSLSSENELVTLLKNIRAKVINSLGANPDYLIPVHKEAIPKTAIGKIQRSQLSDRFHAGEFNSILKQFDILLGNSNTIPDWFYQKVWRPKQAKVLKPLSPNCLTIVFLDELGLGTFICQQLEQQNLPYLCVSPGADFAKKSPNHFFLTPGNAEHYQLLLETVKADNLTIGQILHLWNYQEYQGEITSIEALEIAQKKGIYSLLFLTQALAKIQNFQDLVQLLFVSSYTQFTQPTDKVAYEKSPVLGVIKTIPQEMPWLNCRHIDLTPNSIEIDGNYLLQELQVLSKEQEVAYRNGKRLIAGLEKVNLEDKPKQKLPFKSGGMYLISGGLGGVAVEIAKYLIKFFNAKLLLVGRTHLPNEDIASNLSTETLEKLKLYQELKQLGSVVYEAVDICDFQAVQQVVEKVKANWGSQLDGVIHLAGTYHEQMLVDETPESLAAILDPKVLGAWVLHQVLEKQGKGVFISFSSLASFFGGATISAYAAANNFLESFNQYQRSIGGLHSYCFAWTIWHDTGINKGYQRQEITHAQGFYEMSLQQGLYSFLIGLYHDQAQMIVGLDGSNPKIRRFTSEFPGLQKLTAYFTTSNGSVVPELSDFTVRDRFTTTVNCDFVQLSQMPLTAKGEINRDLLARGMTSIGTIAPRNETERQIAQSWQEVLGISQIGIHDNFFELGGNSLLVFQVIARLREAFAVELSPNRFFASPTIAGLGESLEALLTVAKQWNQDIDDAENEYEVGVL